MILKRIFWTITCLFALLFLAVFIAYWMSSNVCVDKPALSGQSMKAVTYCEYGGPEVLEYGDVERPVPGDNELLVKVHAASANPLDWHYMRGTPYVVRVGGGLRYPQDVRMGVDFAGTVETVGKNVKQFQPGDEVIVARNGAMAEYVIVGADRGVVHKPSNISFAQAAAVPIAALTALQAIRDKGKIEAGQSVLVNGASGGVGTFAVQIAKAYGAEVTGVSSTRNQQLVKSLGADFSIDYTREDYTQGDQRYDVILDCVGNHSLLSQRKVLKPGGKIVLIGGPTDGNWIGAFLTPLSGLLLSPFYDEDFVNLLAEINAEDLAVMGELMRTSQVTPVIDRKYPLSEASEAIAYLETGRARGKVILTME